MSITSPWDIAAMKNLPNKSNWDWQNCCCKLAFTAHYLVTEFLVPITISKWGLPVMNQSNFRYYLKIQFCKAIFQLDIIYQVNKHATLI